MENWGWLDPRDDLYARDDEPNNGFGGGGNNNNNGGGSGGGVSGNFRSQRNNTAIVNEFRFAAAKSIRTSTIILAVFNVVAAFATAVGILWDCYNRSKRNNPKFKFRTSGLTFVGPAETFPLVLSVGIVVQGTVFAIAQSTGLEHLQTIGCTLTSQMMLPAVFIVPYIQLVFGLEVVIRALHRRPFPIRSKWNVTICLAIIGTFLLITYLVTHFIRPGNFCFASLFFFVRRWKDGCFVLLTVISAVLLISPVVLFWRLHNYSKIDSTERIAASRMVYYLAVAAISTTLLIPFFFTLAFSDERGNSNQSLTLSMIASVVANVSGLMTGGLHLFLRSNTLSTIGPRSKWESERQKLKRGIRVWAPNHYDYSGSGSDGSSRLDTLPVSSNRSLQRVDSMESLVHEKDEEKRIESPENSPTYDSPNPLRSNAVYATTSALRAPEPAQMSTLQAPKTHARKGSYSLFPADNGTKSVTLLPSTTYSPTSKVVEEKEEELTLKPPPSIHPGGSIRHRRDSSMASSATVQIGLRLSNVDDMPPLNSRYFQEPPNVHNLGCPNERSPGGSKRPSPLVAVESTDDQSIDESSTDAAKDARMKTLPPVPKRNAPTAQAVEQEKQLMLSPTVYNPASPTRTKITSPKGVGFNSPVQKSQASPSKSSEAAKRTQNVPDRADWI